MFLTAFICLTIWLQNNSKSYGRISTKLSENGDVDTKNKRLDSGGEFYHYLGLAIFRRIFIIVI